MRTILQTAAAIGFAAATVLAADPPAVTRWVEPHGQPRPQHAAGSIGPSARPAIQKLSAFGRSRLGSSTNRVCLVIHSNLLASVSNELAQYEADLQQAGFAVTRVRYDSGTAADLRNTLIALYGEADSLAGAVLIGEIPYITYELTEDFGSGDEYEDFPCDIFYADLNGTWEDLTNVSPFASGKYDTRRGDLGLEIWVSRMKTANLSSLGSQTNLLKNYFDKDHRYRIGAFGPNRRALVYDDDDWSSMATDDAEDIGWIYGGHVSGTMDAESTAAPDYIANHLTANYELVQIRSHGYSTGHGFYTNSRARFDYVYASDYRQKTPRALLYSFYVCSGSDFSTANNLASTAVFNTNDSGLAAWGSTKTGGMWMDEEYYGPLSQGQCLGEAFRRWFNTAQSTYPSLTPPWWYGMVMIGDGALTLNGARLSPTNTCMTEGGGGATSWSAVQGDVYRMERCIDPVRGVWTNACGVATATAYTVSFADTNAGPFAMYRLVRDGAASANLLTNGGFELPGTSDSNARYWQWGTPDTHGSTWDNVARTEWRAHEGEWEGTVRGTWAGAASGGWWQETAATSGTTYEASAWFWADSTWTASSQDLKIEFYSSSYGSPLSSMSTALGDVHEAWTQKTVRATAPGGTAWARFVVGVSGAGGAGALQFDDARLLVAP